MTKRNKKQSASIETEVAGLLMAMVEEAVRKDMDMNTVRADFAQFAVDTFDSDEVTALLAAFDGMAALHGGIHHEH